MIGAIIGDIVGSDYEFQPVDTYDFELFPQAADFTDDSLMTIAVAMAIKDYQALDERTRSEQNLHDLLVSHMQTMGRRFPDPKGAYGGSFGMWLGEENPEHYNSWGNGSAMRVCAAAELATSLEEALYLAKASAEVTHNHPEGIKGAQAVAAAIYLAQTGKIQQEIAGYIRENFYDLDFTIEQIKPTYGFYESCQETVPQAIQAFLESESFEQAIRNTIWLGGDADTMGAITGSIAWAYYKHNGGVDPQMRLMSDTALEYLPQDLRGYVIAYEAGLAEL